MFKEGVVLKVDEYLLMLVLGLVVGYFVNFMGMFIILWLIFFKFLLC